MKKIAICTDLAFCIMFLPLMLYAFPVERWWATRPGLFAVIVIWLYVTYFLYKYLIVPNLFKGRRQRIWAIVAIVLSIAVTLMFTFFDISSPMYSMRKESMAEIPYPIWGIRPNRQAIWLHYIIVVFFCFAVGMVTEVYRQKLEKEEMEVERNKAELALYKAQINPHFLFNTLNTIYGLLITGSDKTADAMERFICLTKYMYGNAARDFIPLSEEASYISQFIDLQRLRTGPRADITFECSIEDNGAVIPPMMLITFVENVFKHGMASKDVCKASIRLIQEGRKIVFTTENPISGNPSTDSGTGIANCSRRLSLLYPGSHRLEYGPAEGGVWRTYLEINNL